MRTRAATAAERPITVASFISLAFWLGGASVVVVVSVVNAGQLAAIKKKQKNHKTRRKPEKK